MLESCVSSHWMLKNFSMTKPRARQTSDFIEWSYHRWLEKRDLVFFHFGCWCGSIALTLQKHHSRFWETKWTLCHVYIPHGCVHSNSQNHHFSTQFQHFQHPFHTSALSLSMCEIKDKTWYKAQLGITIGRNLAGVNFWATLPLVRDDGDNQ